MCGDLSEQTCDNDRFGGASLMKTESSGMIQVISGRRPTAWVPSLQQEQPCQRGERPAGARLASLSPCASLGHIVNLLHLLLLLLLIATLFFNYVNVSGFATARSFRHQESFISLWWSYLSFYFKVFSLRACCYCCCCSEFWRRETGSLSKPDYYRQHPQCEACIPEEGSLALPVVCIPRVSSTEHGTG